MPESVVLPGVAGAWRPFPVEYKRGRRKSEISYLVQLCAQALCLEEMLGATVHAGALYHSKSRRRQQVAFDAALRSRTEGLARPARDNVSALPQDPRLRRAFDAVDASMARCAAEEKLAGENLTHIQHVLMFKPSSGFQAQSLFQLSAVIGVGPK